MQYTVLEGSASLGATYPGTDFGCEYVCVYMYGLVRNSSFLSDCNEKEYKILLGKLA